MKKINEITQGQLNVLKNAEDQIEAFKEIADIKETGAYCIGDTTIKVDNAKKFEVYKEIHNNKNFYYIILNSISKEFAFAYSLYPRH